MWFKHLGPHEHTPTSEDSAALRVTLGWTDVTLASGAKAMLITNSKNKEQPYTLAVMAADQKLDWKKMKKLLPKGKNARMASVDEAWAVTKCKPGGVPPFGSLFDAPGGVKTYVDPSLQAQGENCNFNCGLRTRSMQMKVADYLAIEKPEIASFCS
jgi:prolyl-tRNA editing enzyme YbaK/EbsC (Cys-tRNA(Pro) deacylase)